MIATVTKEQLEKLLTELPAGARLEVHKTPAGDLTVHANGPTVKKQPQTKEDIIRERWPQLIGTPITISEAADKYDIPRSTIQSWIYRSGYLQITDENSYPKMIDEAEVAYCAGIYHERKKTGSKAPLLDEKGLPYELKRPNVAAYRRQKRAET